MEFRDTVKTVELTEKPDRIYVPTREAVAFQGLYGIEVARRTLQIQYVFNSGNGMELLAYPVRWAVEDPVQGYSGRIDGVPNIASLSVDWGDGQTVVLEYPFDAQVAHTYEAEGDYAVTATVQFGPDYPAHLALEDPTGTYVFQARQPMAPLVAAEPAPE